jgi:hypothetical protein
VAPLETTHEAARFSDEGKPVTVGACSQNAPRDDGSNADTDGQRCCAAAGGVLRSGIAGAESQPPTQAQR